MVAEQTLNAIQQGQVDALVVAGPGGEQVFTLKGAETPYRLLIEAMNEGAATILPNSTILYCNKRFAEMVGMSARKIIGSPLDQFVAREQREPLRERVKSLSGKGCTAEFNLCSLPVQLSFRRLQMDDLDVISVVVTDLSERKQYERDLQRQNEELERRVAARTKELTDAHEALGQAHAELNRQASALEEEVGSRTAALEQSVRALEEFCYTIAHDLRAPLRTMHGFSAALVHEFGEQLGDRGRDYANRIQTSAARMDALIRDLLAYGRLNSAEVPLGNVDPFELVQQWVEKNPQAEPNLRIQTPLPAVHANAVALGQVLDNLLENAIKFVPPDVTPKVRISAKEHGDRVRLCIQDTGIGLAIVRKAAERMGGRVGVESEPGKGSCFWIELRKAGGGVIGRIQMPNDKRNAHTKRGGLG